MKPSEAILKGFEMAGERQCIMVNCKGDPEKPDAVCAIGAIQLVEGGNACFFSNTAWDANDAMEKATGYSVTQMNDGGMSIPDIAGILAAEGF